MAIKSMTYYDIPQDIRTEAASKARFQLRTSLVSPAYTEEQRQEILKKIERLSQWEVGTLPIDGVQMPVVQTPTPRPNFFSAAALKQR
jgi:hypothetical protein